MNIPAASWFPRALFCAGATFLSTSLAAAPDWVAAEEETLAHFEAMVQIQTPDPPGHEAELTDYLMQVLQREGIDVATYALEEGRPNLVARLKGNGSKKPLLLMAHQDTVNVDEEKWSFPPFGAYLDNGWIYGRGTLDDKDNLTASLMALLLLKREGVPLDRDVILLAEAGEEGSTHVGIQFMVEQHFDAIDAEFCLAETGSVVRQNRRPVYAGVQTVEKLPRAIELFSNGTAGHGSVPLRGNALVHLAQAVEAIGNWQAPLRLSDTTTAFFSRLAELVSPEEAAHYRALLDPGSPAAAEAFKFLLTNQPARAAMLHSTLSPTIIEAGYRVNVIPSSARAIVDVRLLPDEDPEAFLEMVRNVVSDPDVTVSWAPRNQRPGASSRLDTEAYAAIEKHYGANYGVPVLPIQSNGATDMAFLRAKGVQCYGVGPGIDDEDAPLGFGSHSDQERILESELYTFVRTYYDIVRELAESR